MNPKSDPTTEAKAKTEPQTLPGKAEKPLSPDLKDSLNTATASLARAGTIGLSPELTELVMELKDTVKGLNPKKLTGNTLRRSLASVHAILADIEKL